MINGETKLLCLLGLPVKQSFSPMMHNASFKKLNINASYMAFDVTHDNLSATIQGLRAMDFVGANVTKPHKINVMSYLDIIDEKAQLIGAVNTIVNCNGQLIGYNTDVDGFIESFKQNSVDLEHKSVAVLGTGGASKAIVVGLLSEGVDHIDVFSRKLVNAEAFIADINIGTNRLLPMIYKDFDYDFPYDVIVNTTPVGMNPEEMISIIDTSTAGYDETVFYDLIYNPAETEFLKRARESKRLTINGLDMLIFQGIYALKHWFPGYDIDSTWTKEDVMLILKTQKIIS